MSELDDFARTEQTITELQQAYERVARQLVREKSRNAELVEAVLVGARDAYLAIARPAIAPPKKDRRQRGEEAALWHLTDWQGGKETSSYNLSVMSERVENFITRAERITEIQRADHPVRKCVIAFGGDMIEGLFNFPQQPFEVDSTLFGQWASVSDLVALTVRRALGIYDTVEVVGEWGNHGRIGPKRATVPRSDNIDRMVYAHARAMLAGENRLTWKDSAEDIQRLEVGNYRALVVHGDEIGRNGYASPLTILRCANQWRSGAYPWEFRDIYCAHYHNHQEFSMANGHGSVYFTGSIESDNRYARDTMAAAAQPSQRLHFIDPEEGRVTAVYKVYVAR